MSGATEVEITAICCRYSRKRELPKFVIASLRSLYHLATSKVCVLDAYWPIVSILKHKDELTVIQMWHSLGKVKKTGYQTLGSPYGSSEKLAKYMNMHRNYDYIIAGGRSWNMYYCEAFDTTEDVLVNIGLPRIDYLLDTQSINRSVFFNAYTNLEHKTIILYAPTFRHSFDASLYIEDLINSIDYSRYALIVKAHPNQQLAIHNPAALTCDDFKAIDLLAVCDFLITDYSAIAIEAAVLNKKTFYYLYDLEHYIECNGVNIDLPTLMDGCVYKNATDLVEAIISNEYPQEKLDLYRAMYLPNELGISTKKLSDLVIRNLHSTEPLGDDSSR